MMGSGGSWWTWLLPASMLAVLAGAVGLLVSATGEQRSKTSADADPAMKLLREQFSQDEIDSEEFERRRKRLEKNE